MKYPQIQSIVVQPFGQVPPPDKSIFNFQNYGRLTHLNNDVKKVAYLF